MNSGCVDLIYLDPPFNSNRDYAAPIGSEEAMVGFKDTWTLNDVDLAWHGEIAESEPALYAIIDAAGLGARQGDEELSDNDGGAAAGDEADTQRQRVVLYLHCDDTASTLPKVGVWIRYSARQNYIRVNVVWKRTSAHRDRRQGRQQRFGRVLDHCTSCSTLMERHRVGPAECHCIRPRPKTNMLKAYPSQDERGRFRSSDLTGAGVRNGQSGEPWREYSPTDGSRHWAVPRTGKYAEYIQRNSLFLALPATLLTDDTKGLDALDKAGLIHHPKGGEMVPGI